MKVAVLYGGLSSEREVSLNTGKNVYDALKDLGYDAFLLDVKRDIAQKLYNLDIDFAFIALHGRFGEDGVIQGLLDLLQIPYSGSGLLASALAMDKFKSKQLFEFANIPVAKGIKIVKGKDFSLDEISFPVIIKPNRGGSTIGTYIVYNEQDLKDYISEAFRFDNELILEEYIKGREFTVPILGNRVLPIIEIKPVVSDFYDYKAKYEDNGSKHIINPEINKDIYNKLKDYALKAFEILGCQVIARVDFIVAKDKPFILEVNTIPGMTKTSLVPESANYAGISFLQLIEEIVRLSLNKYDK